MYLLNDSKLNVSKFTSDAVKNSVRPSDRPHNISACLCPTFAFDMSKNKYGYTARAVTISANDKFNNNRFTVFWIFLFARMM